jgi:pantoate--beta-alanine ligase
MGSLHAGHLDLIRASLAQNDVTAISIFVNPSQFAPNEDLATYPRDLEGDLAQIRSVLDEINKQQKGRNNINNKNSSSSSSPVAVFTPSVQEMYPDSITGIETVVEVVGLSSQLEGSVRPHFFKGVATVVTKLLNVVQPQRAYFGQKDIQQFTVVTRLARDLLLDTEVVMVPTVREASGLAMSSRNAYLTESSRAQAKVLYNALAAAETLYKSGVTNRDELIVAINRELEPYTLASSNDDNFQIKVDYVSIADKQRLLEIDNIVPGAGAVVSAAIRVPNKQGKQTRIIDNILLH